MNRRSFLASAAGAAAAGCDLAWREGSDYPLSGIPPLISPDLLAARGLLPSEAVPVLREIREHNALLFDFVLKRSLASGGVGFARTVFETRPLFVDPT